MKAIILAAGIGSRLRPITDNKPKTLVLVNNVPILGYIINSLLQNGINDIVICTGYKNTMIKEYCKRDFPQTNFIFVNNENYDTSNNLYSLYLANKHLNGDLLLMNADLVFDSMVITKLLECGTSAFCIDVGNYIEESMKVVFGADNYIASISKTIKPSESSGVSIDVYRFCSKDSAVLCEEIIKAIECDNRINDWTETLLNDLLQNKKILVAPVNVNGYKWFEIDNYEDLSAAEKMFNKRIAEFSKRNVFVLDVDGTLLLGDKLFDNAKSTIEFLMSSGKKIYVASNNSSKTPDIFREKLESIGLNMKNISILSSLDAAIDYLKSHGYSTIYWAANPVVDEYLRKSGLKFEKNSPQAILLTYDTSIDFDKMKTLTRLLNSGIPYYATHTDIVCPTEFGYVVPDIGCLIQLLETTTGCRPVKTFGKPNKEFLQPVLKNENVGYSDIVIVGDRLYTDIALAEGIDVLSVLVLSGETSRDVYEESKIRADIVLNDIYGLVDELRLQV